MPVFLSPAKVNLRLDVLGRRADGYHEIRSLMQTIDLCDKVEVEWADDGISVSCNSPDVPLGEENIAYQAAQAFLSASGLQRGVRIAIRKRIPVGAGLGGGSSNAAAVLRALHTLSRSKGGGHRLLRLAKSLGADVPFFLCGGTACAEGIGDRLTRAVVPFPLWFVLIYPGFMVSTRWAYAQLDALRKTRGAGPPVKKKFATLDELVDFLHNDLEAVCIRTHPEIASAKGALSEAGARGTLMTGSGSAAFGLFADETAARRAAGMVKEKGRQVFLAKGLGRRQAVSQQTLDLPFGGSNPPAPTIKI